jgi:DNA-binding MarR family transcriptional regulator
MGVAKNKLGQTVVDLDRYVPGYMTWIANKLSRGASSIYLSAFDIGIETWRLLVLLAIEGSITSQNASRIIGMDKASVSRSFKTMQESGLVKMSLNENDGRSRIAHITTKGRKLHDQILAVAVERERVFLSVLDKTEQETLIQLLRRLHENLPNVEVASEQFVPKHFTTAEKTRQQ